MRMINPANLNFEVKDSGISIGPAGEAASNLRPAQSLWAVDDARSFISGNGNLILIVCPGKDAGLTPIWAIQGIELEPDGGKYSKIIAAILQNPVRAKMLAEEETSAFMQLLIKTTDAKTFKTTLNKIAPTLAPIIFNQYDGDTFMDQIDSEPSLSTAHYFTMKKALGAHIILGNDERSKSWRTALYSITDIDSPPESFKLAQQEVTSPGVFKKAIRSIGQFLRSFFTPKIPQ